METSSLRPPAVAGSFYPADPGSLTATVDRLLADAPAPARPVPKAIIAPHAGFVYSGPTAAVAWASLRPDADRILRVVLLAPAHRRYVPTLAHPGAAALRTPAGDVQVDLETLDTLGVPADPAAHRDEHAIEVQLPFLTRVLPRARVLPILVGGADTEQVAELLERVWGGDETVIVVSSDLSHFLDHATARRADVATAEQILRLDPTPLEGEQACGCRAINGLLRVARTRGLQPRLLDLRNSGDTAGPRDRVVGYGAFGFYDVHPTD